MSLKLLKKKNYLTMIENAAKGENWMFRNQYFEVDGKETDVLENGGLSCAMFLSSVLYLNKLIGDIHTTVVGTEKDMLESGWFEIKDLEPGAVIIWEQKLGDKDGLPHYHNGFYIGSNMAISNNSKDTGFPWKHHYTYNNTRKIEKIYWHPVLDEE
ncbi:MAG: hypothetical protein A3F98_01390 [Candidatus Yanofskybacteria bacterium RIFCSPLOWO2_12_FULL_41_8]|nr:MAG: hypothetical protein A3F48_04280 [Candidatus Yanofskybacteria bacterium RIFCSPHIGHO2_12_FULL_41_9]OGN28538.1 MAG: hypothetical protein A3H54_04760 [Candidatus Yanofskybacteria bacterium RIFCSPLOWO2_02_FULL_41_13]OGN35345.1 MAG: hypothetical protein A3F98_01390 [Candidatus Yanofskybacteria bacterium RIFCSPLOWO2_12_FULL_41_8]